ncbi:hypothetical protein B9Z52_10635 [Limnohabitans sp. Jir72]|nr:hypothetical protein B9Z52_10635 [Limnohabitans sp. Jir72]
MADMKSSRRALDEIHNANCIDFADGKFKGFLIAFKFRWSGHDRVAAARCITLPLNLYVTL